MGQYTLYRASREREARTYLMYSKRLTWGASHCSRYDFDSLSWLLVPFLGGSPYSCWSRVPICRYLRQLKPIHQD